MPLSEAKQRLIQQWRAEEYPEELIEAFAAVPREEFLSHEQRDSAYDDRPFPIGHKQTISQPSTVMTMLRLLDVSSGMRVLEIGAGSGYVCALLAALGCEVIGLEIIPELSVQASRTITDLGYDAFVSLYVSDGGHGWEQDAPYDRILVSAAMPKIPSHLYDQLTEGGVLVAPVGIVEQRMLVCKKKNGHIIEEDHGAYVFVPLTGAYGLDTGDTPFLPFV